MDEQHANDTIKAAATGLGSAVAIIGHMFNWFPTVAAENFIDVASAAALGTVAAFYAGRRLYNAFKGTDTTAA